MVLSNYKSKLDGYGGVETFSCLNIFPLLSKRDLSLVVVHLYHDRIKQSGFSCLVNNCCPYCKCKRIEELQEPPEFL